MWCVGVPFWAQESCLFLLEIKGYFGGSFRVKLWKLWKNYFSRNGACSDSMELIYVSWVVISSRLFNVWSQFIKSNNSQAVQNFLSFWLWNKVVVEASSFFLPLVSFSWTIVKKTHFWKPPNFKLDYVMWTTLPGGNSVWVSKFLSNQKWSCKISLLFHYPSEYASLNIYTFAFSLSFTARTILSQLVGINVLQCTNIWVVNV